MPQSSNRLHPEETLPCAAKGKACRFCHGMQHTEVIEATEHMFGLAGTFHYQRCASCGSLSLVDVPDDLAAFYPGDYYSLSTSSAPPSLRQRLLTRLLGTRDRSLEATLSLRPSRSESLLDVGCGRGELLDRLAKLGFDRLQGVDPFLDRSMETPKGVPIHKATLAQTPGTFDIILLHHVLEHVEDPIAELAQLRARLNPGGRALLRVPLCDSVAFEMFRAHWVQLDAPRHLGIPSSRGMHLAASKAGMRITRAWRDSCSFQFWASRRYQLGHTLMRSGTLGHGLSPVGKVATVLRLVSDALRSKWLNATDRGDQGCFELHAA